MSITLYTDTETQEILTKLKDKEKNINLSALFKQAIINYSGIGPDMDLSLINRNISNLEGDRQKVDGLIEFWNKKREDALVQEKIKEMEKKKEEMLKTEEGRKKLEKKRFTQSTVKDLIGHELTDDEYDEFQELWKENKANIFQFIDMKYPGEMKDNEQKV